MFYLKLIGNCLPYRFTECYEKCCAILIIFGLVFYFFWNILGVYWTSIIVTDST